MFLPVQYAWAEPVAIGIAVVFIICWISSTIAFSHPLVNALTAALLFALIFGPLAYFRIATLSLNFQPREPAPAATPTAAPTPQAPRKPPANPVTTVPNQ